ncbi:MAG: mftB [Frankiales bacterium]|jgi:putative mycofactocin binding protein MftB|nr:mftB [Frankiales bacterium]
MPEQTMTEQDADLGVDLDAAYGLASQVAVRPEAFGALLYHFGTRRLSFLKDRRLLAAVQALGDQPSARAALAVAGVGAAETATYARALTTLVRTSMIEPRSAA